MRNITEATTTHRFIPSNDETVTFQADNEAVFRLVEYVVQVSWINDPEYRDGPTDQTVEIITYGRPSKSKSTRNSPVPFYSGTKFVTFPAAWSQLCEAHNHHDNARTAARIAPVVKAFSPEDRQAIYNALRNMEAEVVQVAAKLSPTIES